MIGRAGHVDLVGGAGRRGFSLAELVVSMAVMSILFAAITSSVLLASKALPGPDDPLTETLAAGETAAQLLEQVQDAVYITERTARAITFLVADRNGDGEYEVIRYAWSGVVGDPLTRQVNGGSAVTVVADVNQFGLGYMARSMTEQYPGPPVESAEMRLAYYKPPGGANDGKGVDVKDVEWPGQFFKPAFAPEVLSWAVTRVAFRASDGGGADEWMGVRLYAADGGGLPAGAIIDETPFSEALLGGAHAWHDVSLLNASGLSPTGDGWCVVFANISGGGNAAKLRYDNNPAPGGEGRLTTIDAGTSYSYDSDKVLMYEVFGTTVVPAASPQEVTRDYVTGIDVTLDVIGDAATVQSSVNLPNAPEVLSAMWESHFNTDPEWLDINADGGGDWNIRGNGTIDPNNLVGGVWQCDGELDTAPDNGFTEITTVDLRYQATGAGQAGGYFWMNADYSGGKFIPIVATLKLLADMTQQLQITAGGATIVKITGLPQGFVQVRLLIDPDLDTVNVQVQGVDQGTYSYTRIIPGGDPPRATLYRWSGSAVAYDYVRIRVGGASGVVAP